MSARYSTTVNPVGERSGTVKSDDGLLELPLALPKAPGGKGYAIHRTKGGVLVELTVHGEELRAQALTVPEHPARKFHSRPETSNRYADLPLPW